MTTIFNAREVFEIAEQIERNGEAFYRKASAIAECPEAKLFLAKLADMESEHEDLFVKMKEHVSVESREIPDPENQALSYLQAMADGKIFESHDNPVSKLKEKESLENIYKTAIGFEKDSVIFFTGIKEMVPDDLGKEKIEILIKEEMKHIAVLSRELAAARKFMQVKK